MNKMVQVGDLLIASSLHTFVEQQLLHGLAIESRYFWQGFSNLIAELQPENERLLDRRDQLQKQIDAWFQNQDNDPNDLAAQEKFLRAIGYINNNTETMPISTTNVDPEISSVCGPQLVVPIDNARYALNAVNARWCSVYDAIYGSDVISAFDPKAPFSTKRANIVIDYVSEFLDQVLPLHEASHKQVIAFDVIDGKLRIMLASGATRLLDSAAFLGYQRDTNGILVALLFVHHGLHIDIQIDATSRVGQLHPAGITDVHLEAAVTTIQDCEDSVVAVDAEDKVALYTNWLHLMQGTLSCTFNKNGTKVVRTMNEDRHYIRDIDSSIILPGRSLMLIRNVGHLMKTDAILFQDAPIFEGIVDAVITTLCAMYDLRGITSRPNSKTGSVYIVKPKMHGPEEVMFAVQLFERTEELLALPRNTIKIGIMDEERRTSVNLTACINAAKHRIVFTNTGFLDRTGDEIHTNLHAGVMIKKDAMKDSKWLLAYENANVDVSLACKFSHTAQIGKGMWAAPDAMQSMMKNKIKHPKAGANCAWVPSPTAAVLHAMHYHIVNVFATQQALSKRTRSSLHEMLTIPLATKHYTDQEIDEELTNNIQSILGYVVRWVNQGIGCSKVPNIDNIALMEDRATIRISSQHICNWLRHGVITKNQVVAKMKNIALIVDAQNVADTNYVPLVPCHRSIAFQTALELIVQGAESPNGYTEPLLHAARRAVKVQK